MSIETKGQVVPICFQRTTPTFLAGSVEAAGEDHAVLGSVGAVPTPVIVFKLKF